MSSHRSLVIVGAGPAGLSAALRAQALGVDYVLLERSDRVADTVCRYQQGKRVMATPTRLPTSGELPFEEGTREEVLEGWQRATEGLSIRYQAAVEHIERPDDHLHIHLVGGEVLTADHVIISIGTQGNIRKLPGPPSPVVQYELEDPKAYVGETIVVLGVGDSGIENALALSARNRVFVMNRRDELTRAHPRNVQLLQETIAAGQIEYMTQTSLVRVDGATAHFHTPDGAWQIRCDRIIARLGSTPPVAFLKRAGVAFAGEGEGAYPRLDATYRSSVPGLYLIGAVAGYPLIKQGINQGHEVVGHIMGLDVRPADQSILEEIVAPLAWSISDTLDTMQRIELLHELSFLQLRDLLRASSCHQHAAGDALFHRNDYSDSVFVVLEGELTVQQDKAHDVAERTITQGSFVGELSMLSGRRRPFTVTTSSRARLIEIPRRQMLRLYESVESVRRILDATRFRRQLEQMLGAHEEEDALLRSLMAQSERRELDAGEILMREGDTTDHSVYFITRGSVSISKWFDDHEVITGYVQAGHMIGEMALVQQSARTATVRANVDVEVLRIDADIFSDMLTRAPEVADRIHARVEARIVKDEERRHRAANSGLAQFLIDQGLGEATDVLMIDTHLCTACNGCEIACSQTHGGVSRLNREAGPKWANIQVPTSCRHCENPKCMTECPPDAIRRSVDGEVYIEDSCIGCGLCAANCPYDVIQMSDVATRKPGVFGNLFDGFFAWNSPEQMHAAKTPGRALMTMLFGGWEKDEEAAKVAVKCDMCQGLTGGPACVRACPTGAALRVEPSEFLDAYLERKR